MIQQNDEIFKELLLKFNNKKLTDINFTNFYYTIYIIIEEVELIGYKHNIKGIDKYLLSYDLYEYTLNKSIIKDNIKKYLMRIFQPMVEELIEISKKKIDLNKCGKISIKPILLVENLYNEIITEINFKRYDIDIFLYKFFNMITYMMFHISFYDIHIDDRKYIIMEIMNNIYNNVGIIFKDITDDKILELQTYISFLYVYLMRIYKFNSKYSKINKKK